MSTRLAATTTAAALAVLVTGCGSSSHPTSSTTATSATTATTGATAANANARPRAGPLHVTGSLTLPAARSGIAASVLGGRIIISGGLDDSGVSTDTVFAVDSGGRATTLATLPLAVHDAASTVLAGRLLLFGGGPSEGSNRIVAVHPGAPQLIGTLPQALSDLTATTIGSTAYVAGGFNGTDTNSDIYAVSPVGKVTTPSTIPQGVRYPAVGALGGRLIIAGGETSSGSPTADVWSFDPASGHVAQLPSLPEPTDHTSGIALDGTFYVLGGLRNGAFTDAIVSWRPGQARWHSAGRLPGDVADGAAVPFAGGIALVGGRDAVGRRTTVLILKPR
jgi:Galactose oxidase, central domain